MNPLVTVIIPSFNPGEYLRPAVESVLRQTYSNLEILIVDDGSTDNSLDSLHDLTDSRLRILRQPNGGKSVAMNNAIAQMKGEFYAIQDADDLSYPNRIETQLNHLLANPDLAGVFCGYDLIIGARTLAPVFSPKNRAACRFDIDHLRMPGHDPTAMYRLSLVKDFQYDPAIRIAEGLDYIFRVGELLPLEVLTGCFYSYRIRSSSVTHASYQKRQSAVDQVMSKAHHRRGLPAYQPPTLPMRPRNRDLDNNLAAHFMDSVCDHRDSNKRLDALRLGLYCARLHPFDFHYHKALIYSLLPKRVIKRLRASHYRG